MNEAIVDFSLRAYAFLLPTAWIAAAVVVCVLLPLAIFKRTRNFAGTWIFYSSYVFGATTFFLGAAVTFITWGWVGLLIGLFFAGIGVVPVGILAAFISLGDYSLGFSLIAMVAIVFSARVGGVVLMERSR